MTGPSKVSCWQDIQQIWLAPWAAHEHQSGPRAYPESEHPYRCRYHRDRDRIIHCSAFRRLDFKTQVFVPHQHDHFRTRLTHTLEVAQIGRTIARALRLNEDLVEAVALAHDLGHPPFGHGGEATLDELMKDHGRFEHNRQSLRVVDYLEHPYPAFRGLNLTFRVRQCIALHRSRFDEPISDEFHQSFQPPLEGQVVDLADEIAYTSADIEDSLGANWLSIEQLGGLELWKLAWEQARSLAPEARDIHKQIRACKAVVSILVDDLISTTTANIDSAKVATLDDVTNAGKALVSLGDPIAKALREMQDFLLHNVYLSPAAKPKDAQGREMIKTLFNAYINNPQLLPQRYFKRTKHTPLERIVCDFIAGMTDRYCKEAYMKLAADPPQPIM